MEITPKLALSLLGNEIVSHYTSDSLLCCADHLGKRVTKDEPEGYFTSEIHWARIDLVDNDVSHLEPEEHKYDRLMARQ